MTEPFEPLHQPPSEAGMRDNPPESSACARVRGLMRDYADHDLTQELHRDVELHVHDCRTCALELGKSEFEVDRLRRAFTGKWIPVGPRPGLAQRASAVLRREGADEPTPVNAARAEARPAARPQPQLVDRSEPSDRSDRPRLAGRVFREPWLAVAAVAALLCLLLVGWVWHSVADLGSTARLLAVRVDDVFLRSDDGLLPVHAGDVLPDGSLLEIRGSAEFDWRDASVTGTQPAAAIHVPGAALLRLQDGVPELLHGDLEVNSQRAMAVGFGDGSRVDLGEGEYVIEAVEHSPLDTLLADSGRLEVAVEVHRGDAATMRRAGGESAEVKVGIRGRFTGSSGIALENLPSRAGPSAITSGPRVQVQTPDYPDVSGTVRRVHGAPISGAAVSLSYVVDSRLETRLLMTNADGIYQLPSGSRIAPGFVVVEVTPPASAPDLGAFSAEARRLTSAGVGYTLADVVLGRSNQIQGSVVDPLGHPVRDVRIVPVLYDELLGQIAPYCGAATASDGNGLFVIRGLPSVLPRHQHVAVVAFHPEFDVAFEPVPMPAAAPLHVSLQALRTLSLSGLPGAGDHEVYEEPLGLPPGSGLRRFDVEAASAGTADGVRLGLGRLWLRTGSSTAPLLRLIEPGSGGFRPRGESFASNVIFRQLYLVDETGNRLELARETRHRAFVAAGSRSLWVHDELGRRSSDAQVFALARRPRGGTTARFLGLCSDRCSLGPAETELVAFSNDGAVGMAEVAALAPEHSVIHLRSSGSVHWNPDHLVGNQPAVTLRFEPVAAGSSGARPTLLRTACLAEDWTVHDLPPATYDVFDSLSNYRQITVLPGQTAEFH